MAINEYDNGGVTAWDKNGMRRQYPHVAEAKYIIDWLADLKDLFPEAVALAIQMPPPSLHNTRILSSLVGNRTWESHPEKVARLFIYLWNCSIPAQYLDLAKEIVDALISSNISSDLKRYIRHLSKISICFGVILRYSFQTSSIAERIPMNQFEKAVELSDEQFLRAVGVDKATFNLILERVAVHLESLRDEQPMKKRGRKSGL